MNKRLHKSMSQIILCVLAWSCFGMNFGMIGQSLFLADGHEHHAHEMHECCVSEDQAQGAGSSSAPVDHHRVDIILVVSIILGAAFVVFWKQIYRRLYVFCYKQQFFQYIRQRWRQISYIARIYQKLLSFGILHPKLY